MEELTKQDKRQLKDLVRKGNLRRYKEWLQEMSELINKPVVESEGNEFDRCMEITKASREFYKEAMAREDFYRNSMLSTGMSNLLADGYLKKEDLADLRPELKAYFQFMCAKVQ